MSAEEAGPGSRGRSGAGGTSAAAVVVTEVADTAEVSAELVDTFARLIPQLSSSSPPPGHPELVEMGASPATVLLVARDPSGRVSGSLTLVLFRVPTGLRAWIEDVVVDESGRGAGVGEALVVDAVHRAQLAGARSVDLTSRPSRESANRLYRRLGFEERATNVYRRTL